VPDADRRFAHEGIVVAQVGQDGRRRAFVRRVTRQTDQGEAAMEPLLRKRRDRPGQCSLRCLA